MHPEWREAAVLNPASYERLRRDVGFTDLPMGGFGMMRIYCKPGQVAEAWVFSDRTTAKRYLKGELSELDLLAIAKQGNASPPLNPAGSGAYDRNT